MHTSYQSEPLNSSSQAVQDEVEGSGALHAVPQSSYSHSLPPSSRRQTTRSWKQHTWRKVAAFLSAVAAVTLVLACFRSARVMVDGASMKRVLADENPDQGDDTSWDEDTLLESCLDLLEERGITPGAFDVAPEEEAVRGITVAIASEGKAFEPSAPETTLPSLSLGPSGAVAHDALASAWGSSSPSTELPVDPSLKPLLQVLQPQQIPTAAQEHTGTSENTQGPKRPAERLEGSVGPSPSGREESAGSSHPVKTPKKHLEVEIEGERQWEPNSPSLFPSEPSLYEADESLEGEFLWDLVSQQPDTFGAEAGSAAAEGQMPLTAGVSAGAVEHSAAEAAATQVEPGFLVVKMHSGSVIRIRHPLLPTPPKTHPFYRLPQLLPGEINFRLRKEGLFAKYTPPSATRNPVSWGNVRLAVRLSEALALLQQGMRPTAEVTINLKGDILHPETGATNFRGPAWDTWRSDDQNHHSSG
ncbi:hypothetical protein Efla_000780 [Eimeria flavescens]